MEYIRVKVSYYKTYTAKELEVSSELLKGNETAARDASDAAYEEFMNIVGTPPDEVEVDFIEIN